MSDIMSSDSLQNMDDGWVRVPHNSGRYCYFHGPSGYITLSEPYKLAFEDANEADWERIVQTHAPLGCTQSHASAMHLASSAEKSQRVQRSNRVESQTSASKNGEVQAEGAQPGEYPALTDDQLAFRSMAICDERVLPMCVAMSESTPISLLNEFVVSRELSPLKYTETSTGTLTHPQFKCVVTSGSLSAEGFASTKKDARHRAAQALLELLNPTVATYFELLEIKKVEADIRQTVKHAETLRKKSSKLKARVKRRHAHTGTQGGNISDRLGQNRNQRPRLSPSSSNRPSVAAYDKSTRERSLTDNEVESGRVESRPSCGKRQQPSPGEHALPTSKPVADGEDFHQSNKIGGKRCASLDQSFNIRPSATDKSTENPLPTISNDETRSSSRQPPSPRGPGKVNAQTTIISPFKLPTSNAIKQQIVSDVAPPVATKQATSRPRTEDSNTIPPFNWRAFDGPFI
ncbi:hypothetical protein AC1031_019505 [Aphanomyces cochlioides]|nr:hypothetical protein AC1031_019505 [Aphanomyces cochlioides]